jgi:23S rRNA (guanosine2251-2'-O)-methyltransferase
MSAARLVFGLHPVREALAARRREIAVVYTSDEALEAELGAAHIVCERRTRSELDAIAGPGARHQGAVAVVGEYPYAAVEDLCAGDRPLILALDSVTDPQNLGALVRSAHVLGASGVLLPRDRAAQVTAAVVRASAGATEHTRIASVVNLVRTLEELKERGLWVVGAVCSGPTSRPPWEIDLRDPTVLVIGSEGAGLRRLVEKVCDLLVSIPMLGQVASLNASAAGAALLYEAARQRAEAA